MIPAPVKLRRARRTDFARIVAVLAASGQAVPPPDRATLRRFRRVVADLGSDLYVALERERPVGVVYVTYARQLATAARARVETLAVAPGINAAAATAALLDCAVARARRRGCAALWLAEGSAAGAAVDGRDGWRVVGGTLVMELSPDGPADAARHPAA
jgi:N-acetylglutamate synthase-like GNAT family acetyltransferase